MRMVQNRRTLLGLTNSLLALGALMFAAYSQAAAETEVREFAIHVDGKHAGTYQMTITSQNTGVTVMSGKAHVRLKVFLKTYSYDYDGTEVWKQHRLEGFRSSTNDDGKRFQVSAEPVQHGLRV